MEPTSLGAQKNGEIAMVGRFWFALIIAVAPLGCDLDLAEALEDVRSAAPSICKDYCEDRQGCVWPPADGGYEKEAFSDSIKRCTIECAWYASEGAYAVEDSSSAGYYLSYTEHIGGGDLIDLVQCFTDIGAYRCVDDGAGYTTHAFNPPMQSVCEAAVDCVSGTGLDIQFDWISMGDGIGQCVVGGTQSIESMFLI